MIEFRKNNYLMILRCTFLLILLLLLSGCGGFYYEIIPQGYIEKHKRTNETTGTNVYHDVNDICLVKNISPTVSNDVKTGQFYF